MSASSDKRPPRSAAETTGTLLAKARDGDAAALDAVFARHVPLLDEWAHGRLPVWARDMADTHDLVQETVLETFKHVRAFEYRSRGSLRAYLRQALLNRVRNKIRRVNRRPVLHGLDDQTLSNLSSPLQSAIQREQQERYETALCRLKETDRELIVARLELDLSYLRESGAREQRSSDSRSERSARTR
jgi:RNA polymerase sigma-70 factor, ECF subfamily